MAPPASLALRSSAARTWPSRLENLRMQFLEIPRARQIIPCNLELSTRAHGLCLRGRAARSHRHLPGLQIILSGGRPVVLDLRALGATADVRALAGASSWTVLNQVPSRRSLPAEAVNGRGMLLRILGIPASRDSSEF